MKDFRIITSISSLLILMALSSCFKEDEMVTPHEPGEVKKQVIEMTGSYRYQIYYDLGEDKIVSINDKTTWDLSFDCSDNGWLIKLNSSKFMLAGNTLKKDIKIPVDTLGLDWKYDKSNGNPDSNAIGKWVVLDSNNIPLSYTEDVYVIDRGYDSEGVHQGIRKIQFTDWDPKYITMRFAELRSDEFTEYTVSKNPLFNFIQFSFDENGKTIEQEPVKTEWDLVFTQYSTLLYTNIGEPYPYLVTGVLLNSNKTEAALDTSSTFQSISRENAEMLTFSQHHDVIGYDWKEYVGELTSGTYVVNFNYNYIIKDCEGFYYKLRFIDFYNETTGEKGFPTFEFQLL